MFSIYSQCDSHLGEWFRSSVSTLHSRAARDFESSSSCEQIVTENAQIDGRVLDLVLTDFPGSVVVRVDSQIGTLEHSAVFIDFGLTWCVGKRPTRRT